jgi:hypothetical protein
MALLNAPRFAVVHFIFLRGFAIVHDVYLYESILVTSHTTYRQQGHIGRMGHRH